MPLPHFLMLVAVVILAAGTSLLLALAAGVPPGVLALGLGSAALLAHVLMRQGGGPGRGLGPDSRRTPGA